MLSYDIPNNVRTAFPAETIASHIDCIPPDSVSVNDLVICDVNFVQYNPCSILLLKDRRFLAASLENARTFAAGFQETRPNVMVYLCLGILSAVKLLQLLKASMGALYGSPLK